MGIHGLMALINEEAPGAVKEQVTLRPKSYFNLCFKSISQDIKAFTGRKVAIDASMALYQFLIAVIGRRRLHLLHYGTARLSIAPVSKVRSAEHSGAGGGAMSMLTNDAGEVTSHIQVAHKKSPTPTRPDPIDNVSRFDLHESPILDCK